MAAPKTYFPRANQRFLPSDQGLANDSKIFELDESEVWNVAAARSQSPPEFSKPSSRISRKASSGAARGVAPSSMPVNVPDWSKILKDEYRENRRRESDDVGDDYYDDEESGGDRIPPHEFLARQGARSGIASFSVHEGIGRTLKGRDLSRVRNAIWRKTGFED